MTKQNIINIISASFIGLIVSFIIPDIIILKPIFIALAGVVGWIYIGNNFFAEEKFIVDEAKIISDDVKKVVTTVENDVKKVVAKVKKTPKK